MQSVVASLTEENMDGPEADNDEKLEICRLCAAKETSEDIFQEDDDCTYGLREKIQLYLHIKIDKLDNFPKRICKNCANKLNEFHEYRKSCLKTQFNLFGEFGGISPKCGEEIDDDDHDINIMSNKNADFPEDVKEGLPELAEPNYEDYVLMKEETFTLDHQNMKECGGGVSGNTSSILGDYLIEFNHSSGGHCGSVDESKDKDIFDCQKLRREVLPAMWDVYEKTPLKDEEGDGDDGFVFSVTHRRYIVNKFAFPCSLCGECFEFDQGKRRDDYSCEDAKGAKKSFDCLACGKVFPRRSSWKRHQSTHEDAKPYVCRMCQKGFNRREHLSRHLLSHGTVRPYVCGVCSKQFIRKEHLHRHRMNNPMCGIGEDVRPFGCEVCPQTFVRKEHLWRHRKRAHDLDAPEGEMEPKPFSCDLCGKTFTRREHLKRHQQIHERDMSGTSFPTFAASLLPEITLSEVGSNKYGIFDKDEDEEENGDRGGEIEGPAPPTSLETPFSNLDKVISSKSAPSMPVPVVMASNIGKSSTFCHVCFKNFSRRSHLLRHMKRIHSMQLPPISRKKLRVAEPKRGDENGNSLERNFPPASTSVCEKCRICGKVFSKHSLLERHEKIHRNIARDGKTSKYECVTCGQAFVQSKLLDKHMATHGNAVSENFVWI